MIEYDLWDATVAKFLYNGISRACLNDMIYMYTSLVCWK